MGRLRLVPQAIVVAALALAAPACSGLVTGGESSEEDPDDDDDGDGEPDEDDGEPVEPDAFEAAPAPAPLGDAIIADVTGEVRALVNGAPYTHSVLVVNGTTGEVVADSNPNRLLTPASNTKLYTTAAAMELLGDDHGISTRVYTSAPIGADGSVAGDLTILLEHDFTLSSDIYDGPRQPLDRLARALRDRGLTSVTGTVRVSGESVYEANSIGFLNVATERAQTTDAVSAALTAVGISAGAVASAASLEPPAGATLLLERAPIPLAVGESPLNTDSNNEFADLLIRHVGWKIEGTSSATAGTKAVLDWLASGGIDTTGISLNDGSGLSHDNKVSARSTVGLLRFMEGTAVGARWMGTFSIAGVRGTLGGRLTGGDTAGRVFGKTGSLNDTIALSGVLEHRYDGQRYFFSILLNQAGINQTSARALADDVVRVFARNLRGNGARLAAPELALARPTGTAGVLEIEWSEVSGADGYLVWLSEDGRVWRRQDARYVHATHFNAGELSADRPTYVRVTARAAEGLESDPSQTYAGTASEDPAELWLVDANDRWKAQPAVENHLERHHEFLAALAESAGARRVASANHAAVIDGSVDLDVDATVLWALGEESTMTAAMTPEERGLVEAFVEEGGALIFSGAEAVWALADQGGADEKAFATDVLGVGLATDDAGTYEVMGAGSMGDVTWTTFLHPDAMDIMFPDALTPAGGATTVLRYVGGMGGAAAVATTGGRRVLVTGFPIESLPSAAARAQMIDAAFATLE